jgi:diadenosine tetraphosphate (Ap4A) HIT family hydrolase
MPESADAVYARVIGAVGAEGRLPAPAITTWDVFPWEAVDGAVVPKVLRAPEPESPRGGEEGGDECLMCAGIPPERIVWEDEHWVLTTDAAPTGLPLVLTLWTREHLDFGDLDDGLASQFGRISNRLVRIIQGLDNIGRVHVNRWGDGGSHFHVWYFARTAGLTAIRGSYAVEWDEILPPGPDDVRRADLGTVAAKLANWGGTARF